MKLCQCRACLSRANRFYCWNVSSDFLSTTPNSHTPWSRSSNWPFEIWKYFSSKVIEKEKRKEKQLILILPRSFFSSQSYYKVWNFLWRHQLLSRERDVDYGGRGGLFCCQPWRRYQMFLLPLIMETLWSVAVVNCCQTTIEGGSYL